jgi:hypothetical protein
MGVKDSLSQDIFLLTFFKNDDLILSLCCELCSKSFKLGQDSIDARRTEDCHALEFFIALEQVHFDEFMI